MALALGRPGREQRRAVLPRRLLSLSGGGFRGLFTARVLERLETEAGGPLRERFDLIGGTSIGGILAIGLAAGVPTKTMRVEIEARGREIFTSRRRSLGGWISAQYDPAPLAHAVKAILGAQAHAPFSALGAPLLVVAIDQNTATPRLFRSAALAAESTDGESALDVALATSAAPTYFPPHRIDERLYVDGGLIANAPDLILATEAMRRFSTPLDALTACVVGTAGSPRRARRMRAPGKLSWIARHDLVSLAIDAQADLAGGQLEQLLPRAVLRIDATPQDPLPLDDASTRAARELIDLADHALDEVLRTNAQQLRGLLSARVVRPQGSTPSP